MQFIRNLSILCLSVLILGCNPGPYHRVTTDCVELDERLERFWRELSEARATPDACDVIVRGESRCNWLRNQIQRLTFLCPSNEPAQLASAILAYDEKQPAKAQQILDSVLSTPGRHPLAAQLRVRIALDEGNIPYTLKFLDQQVRLSPDNAGLREMNAAAMYLAKQYEEARNELEIASRLGTPRWRVAYHLGLIAESEGKMAEARRFYQESLSLSPGWPPAASRLKGLEARVP